MQEKCNIKKLCFSAVRRLFFHLFLPTCYKVIPLWYAMKHSRIYRIQREYIAFTRSRCYVVSSAVLFSLRKMERRLILWEQCTKVSILNKISVSPNISILSVYLCQELIYFGKK